MPYKIDYDRLRIDLCYSRDIVSESPGNREVLIKCLDQCRLRMRSMPWYANLEKDTRFVSVNYEISKMDVDGECYLYGKMHLNFYLDSIEAISLFVLKHEETLNKLSMYD